jgi:hypothetical protein
VVVVQEGVGEPVEGGEQCEVLDRGAGDGLARVGRRQGRPGKDVVECRVVEGQLGWRRVALLAGDGGAVGAGDGDGAGGGVDGAGSAGAVDVAVVGAAEGEGVVEAGGAAVAPVGDVVPVGPGSRGVAAVAGGGGEPAAVVAHEHGVAQGAGGATHLAAVVEDLAVGHEHP